MKQLEKFYRGKPVLITGCHGFKGGWLAMALHHLGAIVHGFGKDSGSGSTFFTEIFEGCEVGDVRRFPTRSLTRIAPEVVFHLAAQPIVRIGFEDPAETVETNVLGLVRVLEACRDYHSLCHAPIRVVAVTSDKCYEPSVLSVKEGDRLGGTDPYSASKACQELIARCWRESFALDIRTVRAGNVIGGGDWSPHRIIPDLVRASNLKETLEVRNPSHIRPWQHVLDCVTGYLVAGMCDKFPSAINLGPESASKSVRELLDLMSLHLPVMWKYVQPPKGIIEHASLNLDTTLAHSLGLGPLLEFGKAVEMTAVWYKAEGNGDNMLQFSRGQIDEYERLSSGRPWSENPNWLNDLTP